VRLLPRRPVVLAEVVLLARPQRHDPFSGPVATGWQLTLALHGVEPELVVQDAVDEGLEDLQSLVRPALLLEDVGEPDGLLVVFARPFTVGARGTRSSSADSGRPTNPAKRMNALTTLPGYVRSRRRRRIGSGERPRRSPFDLRAPT